MVEHARTRRANRTGRREPSDRQRFWIRTTRTLQIVLVVLIAFGVWLVGFRSDGTAAPTLPDTTKQFSLDLKVVGRAEASTVYAVEQRARPAYRILSLEPTTGTVATVFSVPTDAIVYGIALSPDRSTLAVAYSPDFHLDGSGLWTLDLLTRALTPIAPIVSRVYLANLERAPDGRAVLATRIDRTGEHERLAVARVDLSTGTTATLVADAVAPVSAGTDLYYLTVDEAHARRAIGHLDAAGSQSTIAVGDGHLDLDHLVRGTGDGDLRVAVLKSKAQTAGVTVGSPASAHGNHDVPSTWWNIASIPYPSAFASALEPTVVYDAAATGQSIVYATQEGIALASGNERIDLIASRAIRFVAA